VARTFCPQLKAGAKTLRGYGGAVKASHILRHADDRYDWRRRACGSAWVIGAHIVPTLILFFGAIVSGEGAGPLFAPIVLVRTIATPTPATEGRPL
jgi:hypothetical protein